MYSTNNGSLVIKSNSERMNFRWVKFIHTGFEREARVDHIKSGKVGDPFHATVHGVGFLGDGPHKTKRKTTSGKWRPNKVYGLWVAMLQRCYANPVVGNTYNNATVHHNWHNFQTFAKDFELLDGYTDWCNPDNDYQLDKDKYGEGGKLYSKETCCLIPHQENQMLKVAFNGCIKPRSKPFTNIGEPKCKFGITHKHQSC